MNEVEANNLLRDVIEGIERLHAQSETDENIHNNPARKYFFALSGYLADHGILDSLNHDAARAKLAAATTNPLLSN